jgi:outer membrane immunogenic protein
MGTKYWGGIGVVAASIVAGVSAASAADLAVKAPAYKAPPPVILSDWAGFYIGVNGGYGWGDSTFPAALVNAAGAPLGVFDIAPKQKGGLVGGHAGYNWQYGSVVAGVEVDFDGADIKGTNTAVAPALTLKTDELASARARLGYTFWPNVLAYGTAGAGWGHTVISPAGFADQGVNQFGWTAGGGLEYKFYGNWIARAEYLHYDFDKTTAPAGTLTEKLNVVRGGVSYKF